MDGISELLAADRKTLAPLGTAAFQHQAPILRAHANEKPMRLGTMTRIGLKSPNSLSHDIPSVLRRTVNVSERVRGVSITLTVLQSASSSRIQPVVNPCPFGLSPKFSTPVEKTVENRPKECFPSVFIG